MYGGNLEKDLGLHFIEIPTVSSTKNGIPSRRNGILAECTHQSNGMSVAPQNLITFLTQMSLFLQGIKAAERRVAYATFVDRMSNFYNV